MPIPYRKTPRVAKEGIAAYLDIYWLRSVRTFYGALLLIDGRGNPGVRPQSADRARRPALAGNPGSGAGRRYAGALAVRRLRARTAPARLPADAWASGALSDRTGAHDPLRASHTGAGRIASGVELDQRSAYIGNARPRRLSDALAARFRRRAVPALYDGLRVAYPQAPWNEADHDTDAS